MKNHSLASVQHNSTHFSYDAARRCRVGPFPSSSKAYIDETHLIAELLSHLSNDAVMIDVGAHHGSSLRPFHKMNWFVYAYEPNPKNREKLLSRFQGVPRIHVDARAVGDKEAKNVKFYTSEVSTGISGMLAFHESHEQAGSVDVTTISHIIDEHHINKVDFLKIDVEGYDLSVLKGVPWAKLQPEVIECEFEDAKTELLGHTWRDICEFLVSKGYKVYVSEWHPINQYGGPHDWCSLERYPCDLRDVKAWGNLLAFRKDPGEKEVKDALSQVIKFRKSSNLVKKESLFGCLKQNYKSFAISVRDRHPKLFKVGQSFVNGIRFLKRQI